MKTQGEIEAAICEGISRFEQDYMGRGPILAEQCALPCSRPVATRKLLTSAIHSLSGTSLPNLTFPMHDMG